MQLPIPTTKTLRFELAMSRDIASSGDALCIDYYELSGGSPEIVKRRHRLSSTKGVDFIKWWPSLARRLPLPLREMPREEVIKKGRIYVSPVRSFVHEESGFQIRLRPSDGGSYAMGKVKTFDMPVLDQNMTGMQIVFRNGRWYWRSAQNAETAKRALALGKPDPVSDTWHEFGEPVPEWADDFAMEASGSTLAEENPDALQQTTEATEMVAEPVPEEKPAVEVPLWIEQMDAIRAKIQERVARDEEAARALQWEVWEEIADMDLEMNAWQETLHQKAVSGEILTCLKESHAESRETEDRDSGTDPSPESAACNRVLAGDQADDEDVPF